MLIGLARRAGLGARRIHPHGLRHALATELALVEPPWPIELIAAQLGDTPTVTARYIHRLRTSTVLAERMRRIHSTESSRAIALAQMDAVEALMSDPRRAADSERHRDRMLDILSGRRPRD